MSDYKETDLQAVSNGIDEDNNSNRPGTSLNNKRGQRMNTSNNKNSQFQQEQQSPLRNQQQQQNNYNQQQFQEQQHQQMQFQQQQGNNRYGYNNNQQQQQMYSTTNNMQQNSSGFFMNNNYEDPRSSSANSNGFRPISMPNNQNKTFKELGFVPQTANPGLYGRNQNFFPGAQSAQNLGNNFKVNRFEDRRMIPKHIQYDQETLYKENLNLKSHLNTLKNDNYKLKSRQLGLEEQLLRGGEKPFDRQKEEQQTSRLYSSSQNKSGQKGHNYVKFMGGPYATRNQASQDSTIVQTLKKKVQQLGDKVEEKEKIIEKMKKHQKLTKINELEIQNQAMAQETVRLRNMLDQLMHVNQKFNNSNLQQQGQQQQQFDNNDSYKFDFQNQQIIMLKNDNIEMAANLKKMEEVLYEHRMEIKSKEKALTKESQDLKVSKRLLQEREKELTRYKSNDPFIEGSRKGTGQYNTPQEAQYKQEIEKYKQELKEKESKVQFTQRKQQENEKKMKLMEHEYNEKSSSEQAKTTQLQNRILELEQKSKKILEDYQRVLSQESLQKILNGEQEIQVVENDGNQRIEQRQMSYRNKNNGHNSDRLMSNRRLAKVTSEQVIEIGEELKFKLMFKRIPLDKIDQYLFPSENQKSQLVSIKEMKEKVIQNDPFGVRDEEQALNLIRYLIEENKEDYIQFNPDVQQDINIVRSIFKNLVHNYHLLNATETQVSYEKIAENMTNIWKSQILDMLGRISNVPKGVQKDQHGNSTTDDYCSKLEFDQCLECCDVHMLTKKDIDYMHLKLFQTTNNLQKLNLSRFFKFFDARIKRTFTEEPLHTPRRSQMSPEQIRQDETKTFKKSNFKQDEYLQEGDENQEESENEDNQYQQHQINQQTQQQQREEEQQEENQIQNNFNNNKDDQDQQVNDNEQVNNNQDIGIKEE